MWKRKLKEAARLSSLEEDLLALLTARELYGLAILEAMKDVEGGSRALGVGSLYPALHKLEKLKLLRSWWGDDRPKERGHARRRYYKTTPEGTLALEAAQARRKRCLDWHPVPILQGG
jgi:PadR family transcriptional regulator PadR